MLSGVMGSDLEEHLTHIVMWSVFRHMTVSVTAVTTVLMAHSIIQPVTYILYTACCEILTYTVQQNPFSAVIIY